MLPKELIHFLQALRPSRFGRAAAKKPKIVKDVVGAADWMAKALCSSGYGANFSLESFREIDRFFDDQAPDGKPRPTGLLSEQLGQRIFGIGAYIGEVIRHEVGGEWIGDDADPQAEINVAIRQENGTTIWPVRLVMKRFQSGPNESVYAFGVGLTRD